MELTKLMELISTIELIDLIKLTQKLNQWKTHMASHNCPDKHV